MSTTGGGAARFFSHAVPVLEYLHSSNKNSQFIAAGADEYALGVLYGCRANLVFCSFVSNTKGGTYGGTIYTSEIQTNLQIWTTTFSDNAIDVKSDDKGNYPSSLVFHDECPSGYEGSPVKGDKLTTSGYNILGPQHSFSGSTCSDASSSSGSSSPSAGPEEAASSADLYNQISSNGARLMVPGSTLPLDPATHTCGNCHDPTSLMYDLSTDRALYGRIECKNYDDLSCIIDGEGREG